MVSKGVLPVNTVVEGKQGCAPCKILWLMVSKGVFPVKYCG